MDGGSRKTRTPIVMFNEILLFKPDTGEGGLKIPNSAGRSLNPMGVISPRN